MYNIRTDIIYITNYKLYLLYYILDTLQIWYYNNLITIMIYYIYLL